MNDEFACQPYDPCHANVMLKMAQLHGPSMLTPGKGERGQGIRTLFCQLLRKQTPSLILHFKDFLFGRFKDMAACHWEIYQATVSWSQKYQSLKKMYIYIARNYIKLIQKGAANKTKKKTHTQFLTYTKSIKATQSSHQSICGWDSLPFQHILSTYHNCLFKAIYLQDCPIAGHIS